jgi:hypothetical protein
MKRQGAGDAWRHTEMCQNSIGKPPKLRRTTSEIIANYAAITGLQRISTAC